MHDMGGHGTGGPKREAGPTAGDRAPRNRRVQAVSGRALPCGSVEALWRGLASLRAERRGGGVVMAFGAGVAFCPHGGSPLFSTPRAPSPTCPRPQPPSDPGPRKRANGGPPCHAPPISCMPFHACHATPVRPRQCQYDGRNADAMPMPPLSPIPFFYPLSFPFVEGEWVWEGERAASFPACQPASFPACQPWPRAGAGGGAAGRPHPRTTCPRHAHGAEVIGTDVRGRSGTAQGELGARIPHAPPQPPQACRCW